VALFFLGYLVGPLVRVVGTRGLVLAVGGPVVPFTSYGFSAAPPRSRKRSSPVAWDCSLTASYTTSELLPGALASRCHLASASDFFPP